MKNNAATEFYQSLNTYLKNKYNGKVRKVSIDAGFTCPNRDGNKGVGGCIYCNVDSFTQKAENGIREQALSKIAKLRSKGIEKYIIYFQSYSNTYSDLDTIRKRVEASLTDDGIVALYVGTRPDVIDEEKLAYFAELNQKYDVVLEYGLQSANDNTLKIINRGHTKDEFVNAVRMTHEHGIKTCAHIIFGLPGDTREDMLNSVKLCSELGVHSVKFHHLHIVKRTQMSEMYLAGKIMLQSEDEYISVLAEAITYLSPDMVVSRIVGDAAGDTLIAPMWPESKSAFTAKLEAYMKEHGLFQGKNF